MHKLLFAALSAATLFGAALLPERADAISLAGTAGVRLAQDQVGITEQVRERVCRRFCDDGFCRTRCFWRDDDDDDRFRERRVFRDRDRDRDWDRDRDRERDRRRDCARVGPVVVCN
jgi:hypothetical protein